MTTHTDAISLLMRLPSASLASLGCALESGTLRHGFSSKSLSPFCGAASADAERALNHLIASGFTIPTAGVLCQALGRTLAERDATERSIQLVLSGPEVVGTPSMDTKTTIISLFEEAREEVLITSYVFHKAAEFFSLLAKKHDQNPNFRVTFVVDVSHSRKSPEDLSVQLTQTFGANFKKNHWPGKRLPEIWQDPRCFEADQANRGILHAKTVVIDRKIAFITSANFTGAAQDRNIEAGVLIRQPRIAEQLYRYFDGLIATRILKKINF